MIDKVLLANIERLLKAKGMSADALSTAAGAPDAIRNLRRYVSGEKNGSWKIATLEAVAAALGTSPWELLRPPGAAGRDEALRDIIDEMLDERLQARERAASAPKRKIR